LCRCSFHEHLSTFFTLSRFATGEDEPAFASAFLFVTVAVASPPRPEGPASPSRASMDGEALRVSALTRGDEEEPRLEGAQGEGEALQKALLNARGRSETAPLRRRRGFSLPALEKNLDLLFFSFFSERLPPPPPTSLLSSLPPVISLY